MVVPEPVRVEQHEGVAIDLQVLVLVAADLARREDLLVLEDQGPTVRDVGRDEAELGLRAVGLGRARVEARAGRPPVKLSPASVLLTASITFSLLATTCSVYWPLSSVASSCAASFTLIRFRQADNTPGYRSAAAGQRRLARVVGGVKVGLDEDIRRRVGP